MHRWAPPAAAALLIVAGAAFGLATAITSEADESRGPTGESSFTDRTELAQPLPAVAAGYYAFGYDAEQILPSAKVNSPAGTVSLPLRRGSLEDGRLSWHVITEASDRSLARELGVTYAPKLANASGRAVRSARLREDGSLVVRRGAVDFSPERIVVPGTAPDFFPPSQSAPGSVGDRWYSPLVRVTNRGGAVLNATTVAFDVSARDIEFPDGGVDHSKVIDRATAISPRRGTVTFTMNVGTTSQRPVLFIALDSNNPLLSSLEATTYAPALEHLPVGRNDEADSAVSINYIIANGPTGATNPQRQGLNSALSDPGAQVLDIFDGAPGLLNTAAYSPMWDLYVASWTPEAIAAGQRARVDSELDVLRLAESGALTALGGGPVGPSGLISNCPLILHY